MNYSRGDSQGSAVVFGIGLVAAIIAVLVSVLLFYSNGRQDELDEKQMQMELAERAARASLDNAEREVVPTTLEVQPAEVVTSIEKKEVPAAAAMTEETKPQAEANEPAGKQQKAFVLEAGWNSNLDQLNDFLKQGWRVVQTCSMSGADPKTSRCLVILEKP